jgi:uncharacterized protein (DUF1697 family)
MGALRDLLDSAPDFHEVVTYLQSGNVVLSSTITPTEVAQRCRALVSDRFALATEVLVRTSEELEGIVARNPFDGVAVDPRRYQVTFLQEPLDAQAEQRIRAAAIAPEAVATIGREVYAWHPHGIGRSKLATLLSGTGLGTAATARNWRTVTALRDLTRP